MAAYKAKITGTAERHITAETHRIVAEVAHTTLRLRHGTREQDCGGRGDVPSGERLQSGLSSAGAVHCETVV